MKQLAKGNSRKCVSPNYWYENILKYLKIQIKSAFNLIVNVGTLWQLNERIKLFPLSTRNVVFLSTTICIVLGILIFLCLKIKSLKILQWPVIGLTNEATHERSMLLNAAEMFNAEIQNTVVAWGLRVACSDTGC